MGLDITVVAKPAPITQEQTDLLNADKLYDAGYSTFWASAAEFPRSVEGLTPGVRYAAQRIERGLSCSCTSWGIYRRQLSLHGVGMSDEDVWARVAEDESFYDKHPLTVVINFTDCDGVLGPAAVKRLAAEFERVGDTFQSYLARENIPADSWIAQIHARFTRAVKLAAERDGALIFH